MSEFNQTNKPWGMELNTYCMLLHLSQLAGYLIPLAGLIVPIVMWATNKDEFSEVDRHGKTVFNWMISACLYGIGCAILTVIFIGYIGLWVLGVCAVVFAIIGGIKANEGKLWHYPGSIRFFKVD